MSRLKILQLAPLRYLLFKNLKIKNFYRSTQRGEEMRSFAHYFPLSSCKGMMSVANMPLENPPIGTPPLPPVQKSKD
jgi:hypothetical protein